MKHVVPADFATLTEKSNHRWLASPRTGLDACAVLAEKLAPGQRGMALHTHQVDQLYYVIGGGLEIQIGTETFAVGHDTLILIPAGTPHCHWNSGKEAATLIEVYAPAPDMDNISQPAEAKPVANAAGLIRPLKTGGFTGDGSGFNSQQLAQRKTGSEHIRMYVADVEAGKGVPAHFHQFDQLYFMLDGVLEVEIAMKTSVAEAHSLVILPAGVVHSNRNIGSKSERHIALLVPEPVAGQRFDFEIEIKPDRHTIV